MSAVLDTNILIYDTFEDSVHHLEAKELLDSLNEWVIPPIVIHEYVWIMKSLGISIEETTYKVKEYIQHHKARVVDERAGDIIRALNLIQKEKLSLSQYNDKIILSIAFKTGKLATFDNKLRRQALIQKIKVLPERL